MQEVSVCSPAGYYKFAKDVEIMLGSKPACWWTAMWMVISPLLLLVSKSLISQIYTNHDGDYNDDDGDDETDDDYDDSLLFLLY